MPERQGIVDPKKVSILCGEYDLEVRLPAAQADGVRLDEGEETTLLVGPEAVHVFG
jgi:hypothetical protein